MRLPNYIKIAANTHMKLERGIYTTRGWDLPLTNIKEVEGRFYIDNFMTHLDGEELVPILKMEYEKYQY